MRSAIHWVLPVTIVAIISHLLTVLLLPKALMAIVMFNTSYEAGGPNLLYLPERISAKVRKVVRPAPDLAYAICAYDLSDGPVLATLTPSPTYASLSVFADNTDNIFAINDLSVTGELLKIVLVNEQLNITPTPDITVVQVPSDTGLILWRRVIPSKANWPQMDAARREVSCEPYQ